MKKITLKAIRKYFKDKNITPRHSVHGIKYAINLLNQEVKTDAFSLFMLIVENRPINALNTHSYGFHTGTGRYLIDTFSEYYYKSQNI